MRPASRRQGGRRVMIVAGEASGDFYGAQLIAALGKRAPDLSFVGIGGDGMRRAGARLVADAHEIAVVGITEVFVKLPAVFRAMSRARQALRRTRPDLLILIDFPDFNLHLAKTARRLSIPVLYFISPQVWAWRPGRVRQIGERVDHMAVILPFEERFYRRHGVPVTFVGHPLLDTHPAAVKWPVSDEGPVIGLLPGSRDREVARHLPTLLGAARIIAKRRPDARFIISVADSVRPEQIDQLTAAHPDSGPMPPMERMRGDIAAVLSRCHMVIAVSGTVTLEAALRAVPMVIIYRVSPVSYWLGRLLIRVRHIGLANLIAGETVAPELIQGQATPEAAAAAALGLLEDPARMARMRNALSNIRHRMGGPGAIDRVAGIALEMLK